MRSMFISWARHQRRSELLAQHLGATMHFFYYEQLKRFWQTPARYVVQAWQTWHVLRQERPDVIFVQSPPIFCVLLAFLYNRRTPAFRVR